MMGRLLGIDHGLVRIGVAVSDAMGIAARELRIIERKSRQEDFDLLNEIAEQEQVVAFIVGIPFNDSPEGVRTQADTVRLWIERFRVTTNLPVIEWDEQLSSEEARELAKRLGRNQTAPLDDLAARIILQRYLDAVADGLATPPSRL